MCGRYSLLELADFLALFPWAAASEKFAPRYNIAPAQPVLVLCNRQGGIFEHMLWGLIPVWARPEIGVKPMINARAETVAQKPAFRGSLRHKRCVVPASGFYEWQKTAAGKQPHYIQLAGGKPMLFAGLWEDSHDGAGGEIRTNCIITTAANDFMRPIHDRMPALLSPEDARRWIQTPNTQAEALLPLLKPYAGKMMAIAVGRAVNSPACDRPDCIQPLEDKGLFGKQQAG